MNKLFENIHDNIFMESVKRGHHAIMPAPDPGRRKYAAFMWASGTSQLLFACLLVLGFLPPDIWERAVIGVQSVLTVGFFGSNAFVHWKGSKTDEEPAPKSKK